MLNKRLLSFTAKILVVLILLGMGTVLYLASYPFRTKGQADSIADIPDIGAYLTHWGLTSKGKVTYVKANGYRSHQYVIMGTTSQKMFRRFYQSLGETVAWAPADSTFPWLKKRIRQRFGAFPGLDIPFARDDLFAVGSKAPLCEVNGGYHLPDGRFLIMLSKLKGRYPLPAQSNATATSPGADTPTTPDADPKDVGKEKMTEAPGDGE
jgi:hypothetical protein